MQKIFGNHMVTAIDIPKQNTILILDPTNPSIGTIKNGKIYMFSNKEGKGMDLAFWGMF